MKSFLKAVRSPQSLFHLKLLPFQTELPELLGLVNKQLCHFLLNPTLHKFPFSIQLYFILQQHGQNVNTFSPCLLLFLSCNVIVR